MDEQNREQMEQKVETAKRVWRDKMEHATPEQIPQLLELLGDIATADEHLHPKNRESAPEQSDESLKPRASFRAHPRMSELADPEPDVKEKEIDVLSLVQKAKDERKKRK